MLLAGFADGVGDVLGADAVADAFAERARIFGESRTPALGELVGESFTDQAPLPVACSSSRHFAAGWSPAAAMR